MKRIDITPLTSEGTASGYEGDAAKNRMLTLREINFRYAEADQKPEAEVDKSALAAKVAELKDLANDGYTDESWDAFQKALEAAQAVLDNAEATQQDADGALKALTDAHAGLVKPEAPQVDKSALAAKVEELKGLASDGYTADSWKAFADALAAAQGALDSADATQQQIDDALKALEAAHAGLVKGEGQGGTGGGQGQGGTGGQGEGQGGSGSTGSGDAGAQASRTASPARAAILPRPATLPRSPWARPAWSAPSPPRWALCSAADAATKATRLADPTATRAACTDVAGRPPCPLRRRWPPHPAFRFGRAGRICRRVPLRKPVRPSVPALGSPASAGPLRLFARPRIFAPPARTVPRKGDRRQFEGADPRTAPVRSGSMWRAAARMRFAGRPARGGTLRRARPRDAPQLP